MPDYTDHYGPEGLLTRGTVIVVPGRGETRATYARLGKRLAADAYRVRVIDAPVVEDGGDGGTAGPLTAFADRLAEAVVGTAGDGTAGADGIVHPVVLIGADSGAAAAAALLGRAELPAAGRPDALVLAGLPGRATGAVDTWDAELDVRTSCPTHRTTLTQDSQVRRGSLSVPIPDAVLTAAHDGDIDVPVLFLIGDADPLADHEALTRTATSLDRARLSVVRGAHHDVLNDLQHRSVAAEIITFLETLRDELRPVLRVETSSW
ncbi:alpha/beta hydrolase [Streptomyces luomodiensis]|uniref:Alpha/beta hydrolase n=1 Tax=Streptomyces luomodiensis TaxID=3026192 RepID=A0ABY9VAW3_9ACTN|nr:alpha/beta hydrolase [Streptomyces sp. SCA4-21]WNF00774.1 alpha/beta hydrolase [Streptomyces sp. SCA4-21]